MAIRRNDEAPSHDALTLLKADHQQVRNLFQQYQTARGQEQKQQIAAQVFVALENHAQVEELVFYPSVEEETDDEGEKLVEEARQEHQTVKELITALRALDDAEAFETTFHELQQAVEHHVAEEETEMFPLAEAELEAELEALGEQMQEVKQQQQSWSRG